jgi:all-trans-8'-apo-beta-carotenal 15,15'-oxygenase
MYEVGVSEITVQAYEMYGTFRIINRPNRTLAEGEPMTVQIAEREQAPGGHIDWHRIFDTLPDEHDYVVDEIEGRLPDALTGTLYRNGPAKNEVGGTPYAHLFDGDAMLSQFTLAEGQVRYRNRYVRTTHYLKERNADKPLMRGYGQQRPGGPLTNAFRMPANVANISVTWHAGHLLALWEGGRPWQLDPDTLDTIGEYDFDGELKGGYAYSAHPSFDPATGDLFNFGIQFGRRTKLRTYRVDRTGRLHHLQAVNLPFATLNHDCALTSSYMVFVIDPLVLRLPRFLLGFDSLDRSIQYDGRRPTQVILVPRDGGKPRIAECDAFFHYHINNAFEDGDDVVLDLVRYPDYDNVHRSLRRFRESAFGGIDTTFSRMRVSPRDEISIEDIYADACEFPQHDWRLTTSEHRYSYMAGREEGEVPFGALIKVDHTTGASTRHDFGAGHVSGEPIFVPRSPDAAEDDGWLLSVVYSAAEHRSRLVVLDARDLESNAVAVAHLRHHVPLGFHGTFTQRVAA